MPRQRIVSGIAVLAAVSASACFRAPVPEIEAAAVAIETAIADGAPEYAPEDFAAAQEAQTALQTELKAQGERFVLLRSYGDAKMMAQNAMLFGTRASTQAKAAQHDTWVDTEDLVVRAREALTEVSAMLAAAPTGKGTAADLAAMRGDLEGVDQAVTEAEAAVVDGDLLEARSKATAALETTERVRAAIEGATRMTASG